MMNLTKAMAHNIRPPHLYYDDSAVVVYAKGMQTRISVSGSMVNEDQVLEYDLMQRVKKGQKTYPSQTFRGPPLAAPQRASPLPTFGQMSQEIVSIKSGSNAMGISYNISTTKQKFIYQTRRQGP